MPVNREQIDSKLQALQQTQVSIETTTQWFLFHQRHAKDLVEAWEQHILGKSTGADAQHLLTQLYLANDILQKSKKRSPEFAKSFQLEFGRALVQVMPRCLQCVLSLLVPDWKFIFSCLALLPVSQNLHRK